MNQKYELTDEMIEVNGVILHRIKALTDFGEVNAGDLGGWVESERNLSHDGNAWVSGDALVYDSAWVYGNAWVCGDARVSGNARVSGSARVYGNAWVGDNAWVGGNARVSGSARVYGNAWVGGDARVGGNDHLLQVGPIGSRNEYTTFCRAKGNDISVTCGCYQGSIDDFEARVREVHGDSKYGKEYQIAIELAKCHIDLS